MTNTTYYTPSVTGTRVIAYVHYDDGSTKAVTLPRTYTDADTAMRAAVALTVLDQQVEVSRSSELARLMGKVG